MASSEFRRDLVSRDWVVIATGRAKRPHDGAPRRIDPAYRKREGCPFDAFGTVARTTPILVYGRKKQKLTGKRASQDWLVQVVPNKYPAFTPQPVRERRRGPFKVLSGAGHHEVLILRDHDRHWAQLTSDEAETVFCAYRDRYLKLSTQASVQYVSIFHNYGREVGASIYHPHSQIIAIPVIPPDVARSFVGSSRYFQEHGRCAHCDLIAWERREKARVVAENEYFIALCPFASRTSFEVRVYPKRHVPCFGDTTDAELRAAGDTLRRVLSALYKRVGDPPYNFFIHTSPCRRELLYPNYHWHLEIIPKISIWAGFEIATGIDIATVAPEQAAAFLRSGAR